MPIKTGFTLIEVTVALGVLIIITLGSVSVSSMVTNVHNSNLKFQYANQIAQEGIEAVRAIRANSFNNLETGTYHPVFISPNWALQPGTETLHSVYTRKITISSVMRQLTCDTQVCDIVANGGIVDPQTLKIQVDVSWADGQKTKNINLETYLTNWL